MKFITLITELLNADAERRNLQVLINHPATGYHQVGGVEKMKVEGREAIVVNVVEAD